MVTPPQNGSLNRHWIVFSRKCPLLREPQLAIHIWPTSSLLHAGAEAAILLYSNPKMIGGHWGNIMGLATPLLDFTESPFVALYFAFHEEETDGDDYRAVWALWQHSIGKMAKKTPKEPIELIRPLTDENSRLVSQRGLFVRVPDATPIEARLRANFSGENKMHAIKIRIPNRDRLRCLRWLNRTNINHLSLFPDLFGASIYCNDDLEMPGY